MTYRFNNRKTYVKAKKPIDLVTWMRLHDLQHTCNNKDFMEIYSERKKIYLQITLRHANEEQFVEDLLKNNIISLMERQNLFSRFAMRRRAVK